INQVIEDVYLPISFCPHICLLTISFIPYGHACPEGRFNYIVVPTKVEGLNPSYVGITVPRDRLSHASKIQRSIFIAKFRPFALLVLPSTVGNAGFPVRSQRFTNGHMLPGKPNSYFVNSTRSDLGLRYSVSRFEAKCAYPSSTLFSFPWESNMFTTIVDILDTFSPYGPSDSPCFERPPCMTTTSEQPFLNPAARTAMKLATFVALCLSFLATDAFASVLPAPNPASRYMGVKVVRIPTGPSIKALDKLNALVTNLNLERWTTVPTVNSHLDVEVPSASYDTFMTAAQQVLNEAGILEPIGTMHEDLGSSILAESKIPDEFYKTAKQAGGFATPAWFNAYHPYDDHLTFLSDLAAAYPNNAKVVTAGNSVEGREITGINIFGSSGSGSKPAIIWHSNVHAREWITSMVTEYIAYELMSNYANSTEVKGYVDKYDFYIFPVVNPD
ncbi:11455_t:CDS:2, partial [Acaulospora colombiana]